MESKRTAGEKAVEFIEDGMIVGLGTGSTAHYTLLKLAQMVAKGLKIKGVATSVSTTNTARRLNIPLIPLTQTTVIDLTIDGADEVDSSLNGIKGGGGAFLCEKRVALSSKKVLWVVDQTKLVKQLGKSPLPIEVIPSKYKELLEQFQLMKYNPLLRMNGREFFITDSKNYIIDLYLKQIPDPVGLAKILEGMSGILGHGLFLDIADTLIIGDQDKTKIITKNLLPR